MVQGRCSKKYDNVHIDDNAASMVVVNNFLHVWLDVLEMTSFSPLRDQQALKYIVGIYERVAPSLPSATAPCGAASSATPPECS